MFFGLWGPALILIAYFASGLVWNDRQTLVHLLRIEGPLLFWYVALGAVHRLTTTYAVLSMPVLKDEIRNHPQKYLVTPFVIVVGCVLLAQAFVFHSYFSFMQSTHGQLWAFFLLAYIMILWERWHFCAQEFGVLSIYRIRANQFAAGDRKFDRFYTIVLMLIVNMILFVYAGFQNEKILFYGTALLDHRGELIDRIALATFIFGMILMAIAIFREYFHKERSLPKVLFYFLIGSHTMLIYLCPEAFLLFFFSYIIHHWMVAIGLFNRITMNSFATVSLKDRIWKYFIRVVPLFALFVICYYVFGYLDLAGNLPQPDKALSLFTGTSPITKIFLGVIIGLFFAFNFLHYYFDRCFYSFRNPAIREHVSPLLFKTDQSS